MTNEEVIAYARTYAATYARELAEEIIEWQDSAILVDGCLREMVRILRPVSGAASLFHAQIIATRVILEQVSNSK